jgi:hypothetical protein
MASIEQQRCSYAMQSPRPRATGWTFSSNGVAGVESLLEQRMGWTMESTADHEGSRLLK